jgi:hypothetical protein
MGSWIPPNLLISRASTAHSMPRRRSVSPKLPRPQLATSKRIGCTHGSLEFGANFTKAQLIAFFYEPNKDREIKTSIADRIKSSDDVQPTGGSVEKDDTED